MNFRSGLKTESLLSLFFQRFAKCLFAVIFAVIFAGSVTTSAQTTSTLVPSSYSTTSGTSGGQPVASSIDILDESGTTNTWSKYVEFQTTSSANYAGYQVFTLPTQVPPSSVTGIQVKVNYQGPDTSTQTWTWQIYNWSSSSYVTLGTNAGAPSWGAWKILTFAASSTLANYVRASDGQMRVQLVSNNHADNCDIDYEAVVVTSGAAGVAVTISPANVAVQTSQTQQFTATVTGSSNTAVTWQVNSITGGNSTLGTISTSGSYNAPSTVPSPASVNVTAVSQADNTKSATATVTVTSASGSGVTYYVSPGGSDSNSGTITLPFRTIQHAANSVRAGDTVYVRAGTYNEHVNIPTSGSASGGSITFSNYPGESAIIDGAGLGVPGGQYGLLNIQDQSYLTVEGFEIRNYTTNSDSNVPIGIFITGAGSNLQILNNHIHNITTTAPATPINCASNALGLAVYGSRSPASINNLTISGNEIDHLKTGCSESLSLNGNVQTWSVTGNLIHDNNNIGIDAIGYEGTSSPKGTMCGADLCDRARDGIISGNTIYNITSYGNPDYGNQYAADGLYVDGGTRITVERNIIHNTDFGVEVTSENPGNETPGKENAAYVIVRSNLIYSNNASGITIGGYDNKRGGTDHCTFVNNSLYNNDTKQTGSGEFQIQFYATNNIFKNNILYAGAQGLFVNSFTSSESNPADMDYNLYYLPGGASASKWTWNAIIYTGYSAYQSISGKDAHSPFSNPFYINLSTPDLHVSSSSPAVNSGVNLGTSVEGTLDFAGNPRVQGSNIDIGAYEQ